MKNFFDNFSVKEYFLTVLCATFVTIVIGFTYLFFLVLPNYNNANVILDVTDKDTIKALGEIGESKVEEMNEYIVELKNEHGEDYPATGMYFWYYIYNIKSENVIPIYLNSLIIGLMLGNVIYFIFVQKAKGKQLFVEILGAVVILFLLIQVVNLLYNFVLNSYLSSGDIRSVYYLMDTNDNFLVIVFSILVIITYIINIIRNKIIVNKFNKELMK